MACLLAASHTTFGQGEPGTAIYQPKTPYFREELGRGFEARRKAAIRQADYAKAVDTYDDISKRLQTMAYEFVFLKDPEAEDMLNNVMNKIVTSNKQLKRQPQQVLIMRRSDVNAVCFGEGTFGITTAMLTRITSESVLAYVLAHELAHYELDHVGKTVQSDVVRKTNKKISKGFTKIAVNDDRVTESDIDSLKSWVYARSHFSRQREEEADSLGLILITNAGYDREASLEVLSILDSARASKFPMGNLLHDSFNSLKVPFQEDWLSPRLSLFEKQSSTVLFFNIDSLESHPGNNLRRLALNNYLGTSGPRLPRTTKSIFVNSDLENIESALFQKQFDKALQLALAALPQLPEHSAYLKGIIGRILTDLYAVKDDLNFSQFVPTYIAGYSKDLKQVNYFLHNIHKQELG